MATKSNFHFEFKTFGLAQPHHYINRNKSGAKMSPYMSSPRLSYNNVQLGSGFLSKLILLPILGSNFQKNGKKVAEKIEFFENFRA